MVNRQAYCAPTVSGDAERLPTDINSPTSGQLWENERDNIAAQGADVTITSVPLDAVNCHSPVLRLEALFDRQAYTLMTAAGARGVASARGSVHGTPVVAFATDATFMGGSLGAECSVRIVAAIETALRERVPIVGLWHSGGARLDEGVVALDGIGKVFAATMRASGRVPQISVVLGPAAGGAAYGPALTDIVVMSDAGRMFVTGPDIIRSVTGEDVDMERLGGRHMHSKCSGVVHVTTPDEPAAMNVTRRLASLLGQQGRWESADLTQEEPEFPDLSALVPRQPNLAYDVRPFIGGLLDEAGVELLAHWAPNIVTTLGRLAGRTIGVVANNPLRLAGCLDSRSAEKAARFVRMCDSLGVPLVVLVDVPGYLPGISQEADGVVRRGAKLLHAFAEAVVPRVTLVLRKAYGGAYIAMNSRSLGASAVFAWPDAEVAVMGAHAAVDILHRRALSAAPEDQRALLRSRLIDEQLRKAGGLAKALEIGAIDAIIEPAKTRRCIIEALAKSPPACGSHTNIPL
jgi:acetyl-CoA/propionyl-CoA carboxylase carboxyl transferase subunit